MLSIICDTTVGFNKYHYRTRAIIYINPLTAVSLRVFEDFEAISFQPMCNSFFKRDLLNHLFWLHRNLQLIEKNVQHQSCYCVDLESQKHLFGIFDELSW